MPFKKGQPKAKGRQKGTPNKTTAHQKAVILEAFDRLGGVDALVKWGKGDPEAFYCKVWVKLLPTELKNAEGETFRVAVVEEIVTAATDEDHHEDGATVPEAGRVLPQ